MNANNAAPRSHNYHVHCRKLRSDLIDRDPYVPSGINLTRAKTNVTFRKVGDRQIASAFGLIGEETNHLKIGWLVFKSE